MHPYEIQLPLCIANEQISWPMMNTHLAQTPPPQATGSTNPQRQIGKRHVDERSAIAEFICFFRNLFSLLVTFCRPATYSGWSCREKMDIDATWRQNSKLWK